jgi:hypothetical protein
MQRQLSITARFTPIPSLIGVLPPPTCNRSCSKSSERTPNPQQDKNEETDQEKETLTAARHALGRPNQGNTAQDPDTTHSTPPTTG